MAQTLQQYFRHSPFFVGSTEMPDLMWERLQAKIEKIPSALANILTSSQTSNLIQSLTQKYIQLSVQGPDVARLIRDVVIADVFLGDMPQEIQRRLGLDTATAREVANLIVSQLFTPVLEELKQMHRAKFPNRIAQQPVQQQPLQPASVQPPKPKSSYPGEELPESGGNIINLRNP